MRLRNGDEVDLDVVCRPPHKRSPLHNSEDLGILARSDGSHTKQLSLIGTTET